MLMAAAGITAEKGGGGGHGGEGNCGGGNRRVSRMDSIMPIHETIGTIYDKLSSFFFPPLSFFLSSFLNPFTLQFHCEAE